MQCLSIRVEFVENKSKLNHYLWQYYLSEKREKKIKLICTFETFWIKETADK